MFPLGGIGAGSISIGSDRLELVGLTDRSEDIYCFDAVTGASLQD
jgi:hypothetical protein